MHAVAFILVPRERVRARNLARCIFRGAVEPYAPLGGWQQINVLRRRASNPRVRSDRNSHRAAIRRRSSPSGAPITIEKEKWRCSSWLIIGYRRRCRARAPLSSTTIRQRGAITPTQLAAPSAPSPNPAEGKPRPPTAGTPRVVWSWPNVPALSMESSLESCVRAR
jgi:hypothetical protein